MALRALLPAALLLAAPALAAEPACPAVTPEVRLTITDPEPKISRDLGTEALHAETGQPRDATRHHLALTTSRVEWRSEIETRTREVPGEVCARPARIALALVQTEHRVRIAREIPEGGCLWREVLAHERRHVAVNRRSLREAATAARAAAAAWAARAEGHGATLEEAMAGLRSGLRQAIEPALAAMRSGRAAAHAAIDTQAEYERLGRICPADQQRLRAALRTAP